MNKKTNLLSHLKKQVIALKTQLQVMQSGRNPKIIKIDHNTSRHHRSISHSSRFNSVSFDISYIDKGVKKFPLHETKHKNINDIIQQKSQIVKPPALSSFRKKQYEKTKQNFTPLAKQNLPTRKKSPNPLTGEGYKQTKKGIKTGFSGKKADQYRSKSRRHYEFTSTWI